MERSLTQPPCGRIRYLMARPSPPEPSTCVPVRTMPLIEHNRPCHLCSVQRVFYSVAASISLGTRMRKALGRVYTLPMSRDIAYRIALILIAAVHLAVSQRQFRRAGTGKSAVAPRAEGVWLAAGTGLTLFLFSASATLRLAHPDWLPWLEMPLAPPCRWLGLPLMSLGAALHYWGTKHLGRNLTVTISTVEGHTLVTTGPFRWLRHPLYTGGMVESLGVCLLLASGIVAAGALSFWLLVIVRTAREETILREVFGEDYVRYIERVGRFLPKSIHPQI